MPEEVLEQTVESQVDDSEANETKDEEIAQPEVDANADSNAGSEQVETEAVVDKTPAEEEVEFDDGLLARAQEHLRDEQIEAFGSRKALEAHLDAMDRRFAELGRQEALKRQQAQQASQGQQNANVAPKPKQVDVQPRPEQKAAPVVSDIDFEKYKDVLDDEALDVVKEVHNASSARIQQLEQQLQQFTGYISQQQRVQAEDTIAREIDEIVSSFGKDWEGTFGSKPTRSLDVKFVQGDDGKVKVTGPDAEYWMAKDKLAAEINALYMGYSATGASIPDKLEIGKRALRIAFGNEQEKRGIESLRERMNKRTMRATKKPTHRDIGEAKTKEQEDAEFLRDQEAKRQQYLAKTASKNGA